MIKEPPSSVIDIPAAFTPPYLGQSAFFSSTSADLAAATVPEHILPPTYTAQLRGGKLESAGHVFGPGVGHRKLDLSRCATKQTPRVPEVKKKRPSCSPKHPPSPKRTAFGRWPRSKAALGKPV